MVGRILFGTTVYHKHFLNVWLLYPNDCAPTILFDHFQFKKLLEKAR